MFALYTYSIWKRNNQSAIDYNYAYVLHLKGEPEGIANETLRQKQ